MPSPPMTDAVAVDLVLKCAKVARALPVLLGSSLETTAETNRTVDAMEYLVARVAVLIGHNAVLREECKAWRAWNAADQLVGTEDEVDVNANNHWYFVESAMTATDARSALTRGDAP